MPSTEQPQLSDALRRFNQLARLSEQQLDQVAEQVRLMHAARGTCLLDVGSRDPRLLFLLDGELELAAADGARHRVRHDNAAANGPVSRLRPSPYRVTAVTDVDYLWVDQTLLDELCDDPAAPNMLVEEAYGGAEKDGLIDTNATHGLVFDVLDDLNNGRIMVPSEPDIAIRVGRALGSGPSDPVDIASTLSVCPALTLKVLRAARAADPERKPVSSLRRAVSRLGADTVYELAANCVLRETLRTNEPAVGQRMRQWWRRTIRVTAIIRVLARSSERLDPDLVNLVGLLHGIAEPVMLRLADRHRDLEDPALLDNILSDNRSELGRILLTYWNQPRAVIDAAANCNNWRYDHAGEADPVDVLLVAQWHAAIGDHRRRGMPRLEELPAAAKLGLDQPSPKLSLKIVEAADSAIARADVLLGDG